MNKYSGSSDKPVRYGNSFPWAGIVAGLGRMLFYSLLAVGVLVVLGILALAALAALDNEPVGDYF